MITAKKRLFHYSVGIKNKIKYGNNGPAFGELLFINPQKHDLYIQFKGRESSGQVTHGDWDLREKIGIESLPIYRACVQHWKEGIGWKETGIYDYMLDKIERFGGRVDNCSNLNDIKIRYQKLDKLFEGIKKTREFKTQKELNLSNFNESGGILFHIDHNNQPIWAAGGVHRFTMAKILNIDLLPAQLGVVHLDVIKKWKIHKNKTSVL